jgi:hypothetical protein
MAVAAVHERIEFVLKVAYRAWRADGCDYAI